MERSSVALASGSQKCHFSNRKTHIRECHPKNFHPCAGKTIGAERGWIVVVGFACMACIIFLNIFICFPLFSQNALKRILCENRWLFCENRIRILVQDLSSKTGFLHVNGNWVHFDNFVPRLSKTTHFALQRLFESLFWTPIFSKTGANHAGKCMILPKSVWKTTVTEKQNS